MHLSPMPRLSTSDPRHWQHPGVCTMIDMDYQNWDMSASGNWYGIPMCGPAFGRRARSATAFPSTRLLQIAFPQTIPTTTTSISGRRCERSLAWPRRLQLLRTLRWAAMVFALMRTQTVSLTHRSTTSRLTRYPPTGTRLLEWTLDSRWMV